MIANVSILESAMGFWRRVFSHDRHLTDTIKMNFAAKSSAQLQEILRSDDQERRSREAVAAAREVLNERLAGHAKEPLVPEEERLPPPVPPDPYSLGFLALGLLGGLSGHLHVHVPTVDHTGSANLDLPVPFGPKIAWLALETTDTEAVVTALTLGEARPATWAEGIEAAHRSSVYVTPPLADWTLAAGIALFPPDRAQAFVKPLLERLSEQFGEVQYFCTHRDVGLSVWARAQKGRLIRGYGWLGKNCLTLWDEGEPTQEEQESGFRFSHDPSSTSELAQDKNLTYPSERGVMQLAYLWSIDPTTLDEQFKEPVMGLLGKMASSEHKS
jgi:hypothetical protein